MTTKIKEVPFWKPGRIEIRRSNGARKNSFSVEEEGDCFGFLGYHKSSFNFAELNNIVWLVQVTHLPTGFGCASFYALKNQNDENTKKVVEEIHELRDWDFGKKGQSTFKKQKTAFKGMGKKIQGILNKFKLEAAI